MGACILALSFLIYWSAKWIVATNKQLQLVVSGMDRLANVFEGAAQISSSMTSMVQVNRRLITSTESMAAAVKTFTALVVQAPTEHPETAFAVRGGPLPAPPNFYEEDYAKPEDAGLLSQSDSDLAKLDLENELRAQGIETSPDKIPLPDPSQVNYVES